MNSEHKESEANGQGAVTYNSVEEKWSLSMITTLLFFGALYPAGCVLVLVSSWTMSRQKASIESQLHQHGVKVTGQLDGHISSNLSATYLPFTYEYAGKIYKQRQWVSKHYAKTFLNIPSIDILLLPDNPQIAMLASISPGDQESHVLKKRTRTARIALCLVLPLLVVVWANSH